MKRKVIAASGAFLVGWIALSLWACGPSPTCIARGRQSTSSGTAHYSIASPDHAATSWSVPATIDIYDITPGCWYSNMQFKVTIGSCTLWLDAGDGGADDGGDAGLADAMIVSGGPCELPVYDGTVTVRSISGDFTFGSTFVSLSLSGDVTAVNDAAPKGPAAISWKFESN